MVILAWVLDLVLLILAVLWGLGGIQWQGHVILRHAADLRRAGILLALLLAWLVPILRTKSVWLRATYWFWGALKSRRFRWSVWGAAFGVALLLGVLQGLALRFPLWDVGLYHQVVWAVAHGHGFVSTISGAGNYLLDHLSLSYVLLVPIFWFTGSSALTLPVVHAGLVMCGIAAWIWLAEQQDRKNRGDGTLPAAAVLFGLVFDSLWGNLRWGFHDTAIAFAALSWAYAFLFSGQALGKWKTALVFALFMVTAAAKEILLLDVAMALGLWGVQRKSARKRLWLTALCLVFVFVWFEKIPHPAVKNYFDKYYSYLGHGLGGFAQTLLTHPWLVVQKVGARELGRYFLTVFLPWLFLPLWLLKTDRKKGVWLVVLLPSLLSAAIATYPPLRRSGFHYVCELWPILAVLTIVQIAALSSETKQKKVAAAWALLALLAWDHDPIGLIREYGLEAWTQTGARTLLGDLPVKDSVVADELAGPWVANRLEVMRWPELETWNGQCPMWIVVREGSDTPSPKSICGLSTDLIRTDGYWRVYRHGPLNEKQP